jgi:hypothetical protein
VELLDPVMALGLPVGVEGRVGVGEDNPLEDTTGVLLPELHPETLIDAVEL